MRVSCSFIAETAEHCIVLLRLTAVWMQVYKAERPDWPVRVYNLLYENSQEADKFAATVAREVRPYSMLILLSICLPACLLAAESESMAPSFVRTSQ